MPTGPGIANSASVPARDGLLRLRPEASIFHTSGWAETLSESYGYTQNHFVVTEGTTLKIFIPLMEVNSALTGKRAVSLPFSDYCDPVIRERASFPEVMNHLVEEGKRAGWRTIELRSSQSLLGDVPPSATYLRHVLPLSGDEARLYSGFRSSTQRNIRKAEKEGVRTTMSSSFEAVREFYRLNCLTRRDHGLPPQPFLFFRNLHRHLLEKNLGFVVLASCGGIHIAGGLFLYFGDKGFYKYGASDRKYQNLRANNLVMWEAIRWFSRNGFRSFCFGRTERGNEGLMQFKSGWGAEESDLRYYKYDLRKNAYVVDRSLVTGLHNRVFRTLPIPLSKAIGSALYRHMG
jgi:hypothetical protein